MTNVDVAVFPGHWIHIHTSAFSTPLGAYKLCCLSVTVLAPTEYLSTDGWSLVLTFDSSKTAS